MPVSQAVRKYYAEKIFAQSGKGRAPANFRPLEQPHTGMSSVEGCRGGGKNILEVFLIGEGDRVKDIRMGCGLCNPAMYVAADIVCEWARGRSFAEVLAPPVEEIASLKSFFDVLGGPGAPDDAREKFQYALHATQNAVRNHQGETCPGSPSIDEPGEKDWSDALSA